jgi:putative transposase
MAHASRRRITMRKKRHTQEEIVSKLRQVDVLVSQGQTVADAIRAIGVTEVTYYRWRQEYGGLKSDQVKRMPGQAHEGARDREPAPAQGDCGPDARQVDPAGGVSGKTSRAPRADAPVSST